MVKSLFSSFLLVFSLTINSFTIREYENFYSTDGAEVIETLKKLDEKYWLMESKAKHSLFNFSQRSIFFIENRQIYVTEIEKNLRAFGGLRKENQTFKLNYENKEVEFTFNKKTGKFSFNEPVYGNLSLQLQLKFDLTSDSLPLSKEYLFLDKGKIKTKKFLSDFNNEEDESFPSYKISEIRDDDKEYYLWFKEDDFLTTFKIFNDFGPRTATWRLVESMPSEE